MMRSERGERERQKAVERSEMLPAGFFESVGCERNGRRLTIAKA
jgi:hypothetical protein